MTRTDAAGLEILARRIESGCRLDRTWELKGGVSAQVTALEIERADGEREQLVVRRHGAADLRRNPCIATDEFRLLEVLKAAGVPVPTPRQLDSGGEIFGTPCLVVDYVDGEPGPPPIDEAASVGQLAAALSAIHRVDVSEALLSFLPERVAIVEALRRSDESAIVRRARNVLAAALPLPRRNRSVLLHGDFWPGNTLWKDGRLVAVIDWEEAAIGDPLADLANARLELLWALGVAAMNEFTCRCESLVTAVDFTDLPYWDLWAGLRSAGGIAEWGLDDLTQNAMRAEHEAFVAHALETLSARSKARS